MKIQFRTAVTIALALVLWARAGDAAADQIHYVGAHPAYVEGEAFCYIEVPHVHVYAPSPKHVKVAYVQDDAAYHFIGDPVGFGYDGDKHPYYGHHPVFVDAHVDLGPDAYDDEYCYLNGPHYHAYAPPEGALFELKGGAHWYVGKYPRRYRKLRPARIKINAIYQPLVYVRPVVEVDVRPVAYVGPIVEVEAPVVEVEAPAVRAGVEIHVPVPTIEIGVGIGGGVILGGHGHGHKHRKHKKFKRGRGHRKHRH